MKTCYRCSKLATTREHVPPRCLFPEPKDVSESDYRKNLITVPSCHEHNLRKAQDDEFLLTTLAPLVGNNPLAYRQTVTKLTRAINRSRGRLLSEAIREAEAGFAGQAEGPAIPILKGQADLPRLRKVLEAIALGLVYHEKGSPFMGECVVLPVFLNYDPFGSEGRASPEYWKWMARLVVEQEARTWVWKGTNPEVFCYQLAPPDPFGLIALRMRFFQGAEVYVALIPEGVTPPHRCQGKPPNPALGQDG